MALDDKLIAMFRCPESGGVLHRVEAEDGPGFLFCGESRLKFSISELGIPNLLIEDAERLSEDDAAALLETIAPRGQ